RWPTARRSRPCSRADFLGCISRARAPSKWRCAISARRGSPQSSTSSRPPRSTCASRPRWHPPSHNAPCSRSRRTQSGGDKFQKSYFPLAPPLRGEDRGEGLSPRRLIRTCAPSPAAQGRVDLSPQAGRGKKELPPLLQSPHYFVELFEVAVADLDAAAGI